MNALLADIKRLLLSPRDALQALADRQTPAREVFIRHLMPLAAIPAVAQFIGSSLIGVTVMGMTFRVPFFKGLVGLVLTYLLTLAGIAILSALLRGLAPRFGGQPAFDRALPLAAYGATAALLGAVFTALPWLSLLATLAGLYSLYTLYIGIPIFMRSEPAKTLRYFLATIVLAFVCNLVLAYVLQPFSAHQIVEEARVTAVQPTSRALDAQIQSGELPPEAVQALEWLNNVSKRLAEQQQP